MQSPCRRCGAETLHTEEDTYPLCDFCTERRAWLGILRDIMEGRLEVPDSLIEELSSLRNAQAED